MRRPLVSIVVPVYKVEAVSYTHLDVYKRQALTSTLHAKQRPWLFQGRRFVCQTTGFICSTTGSSGGATALGGGLVSRRLSLPKHDRQGFDRLSHRPVSVTASAAQPTEESG